ADTCEQLIEWRSFALWVRAILAAEGTMPSWLVDAIEQRCPGLLNPGQEQPDSEAMWLAISACTEEHVFNAARVAGWIEALHFYSGRDSRSEAVWEAWDRATSEWQHSRPSTYPRFEQWHREALQSVHADPQFARLVDDYIDAEAFAFWTRAITD